MKIHENFNNDCPDYYMLKEKSKKLNSKLVNYKIKNKTIESNKINDFIIDEEICDTSITFDKNSPSKIVLEIDGKWNLGKASKDDLSWPQKWSQKRSELISKI